MDNLADKLLRETTASLGVSGPASGFASKKPLREPTDWSKRLKQLKKQRDPEGKEGHGETIFAHESVVESLLREDATMDLNKMSGVVRSRMVQTERFLKEKRFGVTAKAFREVTTAIERQQKERSSLDQLMDSERVLLGSAMKTADLTIKLGSGFMESEDFHDFCQELRPEVEGLSQEIENLASESRRLSERQLEHDGSIDIQLHKYRESTREWADEYDDRVNSAASRFV